MSTRPSYSASIYNNRLRTDTINGAQKAPVIDGTYLIRRSDRKVTSSSETPDFRRRVSQNLHLPENTYLVSHERASFPAGYPHLTLTYLPNGDQSVYTGPLPNGFGPDGYLQPPSQAINSTFTRLRLNALDKIKSMSFNAAQAFAERRQMANLVASSATKIAKAAMAVKRADFKAAKAILGVTQAMKLNSRKGFAGNWLELQYGWLPLLSDIHGAAEHLSRFNNPDLFPPRPVVSNGKLSYSDKVEPYSGAKTDRHSEVSLRVKYWVTVDSSHMRQLTTLGLTNPALLAWELLPYSFVVDWFVPVGKWLGTFDATVGLSFVGGFRQMYLKQDVSLTLASNFTYGDFQYTYDAKGHAEMVTLERVRENSFPSPTFPSFKDPFSVTHVANALALLTQVFKR